MGVLQPDRCRSQTVPHGWPSAIPDLTSAARATNGVAKDWHCDLPHRLTRWVLARQLMGLG